MTMKKLGTFNVGYDPVDLHVNPSTNGGSFYIPMGGGSTPTMVVGLNNEAWEEVLSTLFHEALEFALEKKNCRFEPSQDLGQDHAQYLFVMDHQQFSDACARVAVFMVQAQEAVYKAWKKGKK